MAKVKSLAELKAMREKLQSNLDLREKSNNPDSLVQVKVPGKDPIVFGHVDNKRADEILEKYVMNNELVEGIIPVNYEKI